MADESNGQTQNQNKGPTLTHSGCINRLREITTEVERLAELDELNPADQTYFDELREEFTTVDRHRAYLERQAHLAEIKSAAANASASNLRLERGAYSAPAGSNSGDYDRDAILEPDSIEEQRFRNPWNLGEMRTFGRPVEELTTEYRSRALSAVEKMPGANDRIRSAATEIIERWDDEDGKLSRLALALSDPVYFRAWSKMAREPQAADLSDEERRAIANVKTFARAMSLTDTAGGYLVPFQLDPTVIITANGSVNQIRQVARQVVATSDVWNGVSSGAVSWSYDAEAAEVSDDATTLAQPTVPIYKAQGFVPISTEAFQDAANVTQEVGKLLAFGKEVLEANAFAVGTGSGMPTGIITALTGTSSIVTSATADTFALADVYALDGALPARYHMSPSTAWLANRLIYNRTRQFDTSGGAGLWAQNIREGLPAELLNHRALVSEDMDGTITAAAENYVAVLGDFDSYVIADRIGMTVEFVPHLFGANRRPTNQRGWLAYVRHGADSVNDAAFRMLNVT
jgi:HK97 family phage major capsid protein